MFAPANTAHFTLDIPRQDHDITLSGLVLCRRRGGNDSGVNDGAFAHEQTLLAKTGIDRFEDPLSQSMLFQ